MARYNQRRAAMLLAFAASTNALNTMTYKGCFSNSYPLSDAGSYQYQTSGYCQGICVGKSQAVLGLSSGSDCWCGSELPATSYQVDDSQCSTPCNGFGSDKCGGTNYWSVYLTGTSNDITNAAAANNGDSTTSSSSSPSSSSTSTSTSSPTTTATPSVITSVSPGNTVLVTVSASATNTASSNSGSSGTSVAGVAAGVVVGIVAAAAITGGIFFWLRHRRRQQAEEDYKRSAQVADFMRSKAPNTGYSQMSDSRLDPEAGRRNSVGSMADEQDYSRRILRVANPDSGL